MQNKKCTIIEIVADYIYFVMTGNYHAINSFAKKLNRVIKDKHIKFVPAKIGVPISFICERLKQSYKKEIHIQSGTESCQAYALAHDSYILKNKNKNTDDTSCRTHMLLILEDLGDKILLHYPKIELHKEDDPKEIVFDWIRGIGCDISKTIKKTIKPISLIGCDEDILLYTAKL